VRILVVGAGAIGGYFGGRLLEAGRDVTFLVRPRRAAQLANTGLVIKSVTGDAHLPHPPTVLAEDLREPYDLILLSSKAYDLGGAIASFAPAMGSHTAILPLLNGMQHLDVLDARFSADRVLGGQCVIAVTLDDNGTIVHLSREHQLTFGARGRLPEDRIQAIEAAMTGAKFECRTSADIVQDMWEKWAFLATLAGATCLMRAAIGDIMAAPGGTEFVRGFLDECYAVAAANSYPPRQHAKQNMRGMLLAAGSTLTSSMLRDIERNAPIEADHIIGDLVRRGAGVLPDERSLLRIAHAHVVAYEARRLRIVAVAH
jgi:2-dehydropantoate 2-reductase